MEELKIDALDGRVVGQDPRRHHPRANFLCVEEFYVHFYNLDDWMGVSSVLKEMLLVKVDRAADTIEELTMKGQEFDKIRCNFNLRDGELHAHFGRG